MAQQLGVRSPLEVGGHYVPAMGLGSIAVSPLDMASAYATLAAGGSTPSRRRSARSCCRTARTTRSAGWGSPKRKRVIPDGVAWKVTQILEDNVQLRHRHARRVRAARGGQDRHDRQARRRLVRRLHARARDRRLGGLPGGRDPDGERPRHRRLGRQLPGRDLAAVWSVRSGCRPLGTSPSRGRYPHVQPFHRGPLALSYDPYYAPPTDDDRDRRRTADRHDAGSRVAAENRRPPRRRPPVSRAVAVAAGAADARARRRAPARSPGGPTRRSCR